MFRGMNPFDGQLCQKKFVQSVDDITSKWHKFNTFERFKSEKTRGDLLNACPSEQVVYDSVITLRQMLDGQGDYPECNILDTLYNQKYSEYWGKGMQIEIAQKSAYVLSLATMGEIISSTCNTINAEDSEAWIFNEKQYLEIT